jgi:hypothetical protein
MPKYSGLIAVAASCLLLAQCAGTKIKVMPGYQNINVEKSKLGIILLTENLAIDNPDDVSDDLGGGETKQVFHDFFTSQLRGFAKKDGKFAKIGVVSGCDTSHFTRVQENLSSDNLVSMRVPKEKNYMGDDWPYLLIFDNFTVSREQKTTSYMTGAGTGMGSGWSSSKSDKLSLTGEFVLWDNLAGKMVALGELNEKAGVFMAMTKNTWINIVQSISSKVFLGKPYGKAASQPESESAL